MTTFYKLWSKTDGSPVFYGKSNDTLETTICKILGGYKKYVDGTSWTVLSHYEIIKNKNYSIEEISETDMKPNVGFNPQNTINFIDNLILDPKAKGRHIKSVYARYNNHITYLQNKKAKMEAYKLDGGKKQAELSKVWRDNNEDMIKQRIECPCGGHYKYSNKSRHAQTARHIKFLGAK